MVHDLTLANRANGDEDKLLSPLVPLLNHTSQALQMRLINSLQFGTKFGIKGFLQGHIEKPLETLMVAAHIAGLRRAALMMKQQPQQLELSFFTEVMGYFRGKNTVDIPSLQKKYKTTAFEVIGGIADKIKADLAKTTQDLIQSGSHVREAKQILNQKFTQYGIKTTSKSQLETIFRTQSQIAFAAGKYNAERRNPTIYQALWGYRYVTAGDDRVRPTHAILDGVTLPKDHAFWQEFYPPNGWNCRCQAIPIFHTVPIIMPDLTMPNGTPVKPDQGFAWSAGKVFSAL